MSSAEPLHRRPRPGARPDGAARANAIPEEMFFLDPDYSGTLQQQLKEKIADGVIAGRFLPGQRMPPSRRLADYLSISRITVTLAYAELVASGYLASRPRSGYFIADTAPVPPSFTPPRRAGTHRVDWSQVIGRRFSEASTIARPADWRRYQYPFIYGQVDPKLFDYQNWRQCALRALGQRDFDSLTVDQYDGDDPLLVDQVIRRILPRRGISARADEVLITLGAQNALWIAAQVLLTQRRTAAIESPCYPSLRDILGQTRCNTVAVPVDGRGLPPEAIPRGVDVVFATVSHQCPTNATLPLDRRKALLRRAEAEGFVIVEDDYEFEISFRTSVSPALKSLDTTGAVIYVGSFSKSLFPGLRLGFIVADRPFVAEARALRSTILRHPPGHVQRSAAYFLANGHYEAQLARMSQEFRKRRTEMEQAISAQGLDAVHPARFGGSSVWLRAPEGVDTGALALRLRENSVLIEPGEVFFGPGGGDRSHFRLAFSSIPAARIPEGIRLIAEAIAQTGPK